MSEEKFGDCFVIGQANLRDAAAIHKLVSSYANNNKMLPRALGDIYSDIREYFVCRNEKKKVVGCAALHVYWKDLAEVRSLAVSKKYTRKGVGSRLVNTCILEAKRLRVPRVFTLTLVPKFFKKLGFKTVDKTELPMKIWADCIRCPKFTECDEEALIKDLK